MDIFLRHLDFKPELRLSKYAHGKWRAILTMNDRGGSRAWVMIKLKEPMFFEMNHILTYCDGDAWFEELGY